MRDLRRSCAEGAVRQRGVVPRMKKALVTATKALKYVAESSWSRTNPGAADAPHRV